MVKNDYLHCNKKNYSAIFYFDTQTKCYITILAVLQSESLSSRNKRKLILLTF